MKPNLLLFSCILLTALENVFVNADAKRVDITNAMWNGVGTYIAVNRTAVEKKLEEFHNLEVENGREPELFIPEKSVFPDILSTDHHVVYVEFGYMDSNDLAGELLISSHGSESAIAIPFLADSPDGYPNYALALGQLYQRDRGDVEKDEIVFPYYGIDELHVDETSAVWRDGKEELRASIEKSNPCKPLPPTLRDEFETITDEELIFGASEPDFSFCIREHLGKHKVCDILTNIKSDVEDAFPNLCQYQSSESESECEASVTIEKITPKFRKMLLLGEDDDVKVVASEVLFGDWDIGIKYPCME